MNKNVSKNLENTPKQIQSTVWIFNTWLIEDNCSYSFSIFEKANLEFPVGRSLKISKNFQTKYNCLELLVDKLIETYLASKKLFKEKSKQFRC